MDDQFLLGRRVLVIEDEMLVLIGIEDMLADHGCTSITIAGNLPKALELIAAERFDVATLDVNLNGLKSYPAAKALRAAGVPFAFSTGYGGHGDVEGFENNPVLTKPYTCPQLINVLAALLAEVRLPALAA